MSKIVFWVLLVIVLLLVVTHASGFASAVSSVGGFALDETAVLSGGSAGGARGGGGVGSAGTAGHVYGFNSVAA